MQFYIQRKVFSFSNKFSITDALNQEVYKAQGKIFSLHSQLDLLNIDDSLLFTAKKKVLSIFMTYFIFDNSG